MMTIKLRSRKRKKQEPKKLHSSLAKEIIAFHIAPHARIINRTFCSNEMPR